MPYIDDGEFMDGINRALVNLQDISVMVEDFKNRVQEAIDAMEEWKNEYD